jgi:predicted O-methyltransferase YrrM
MPDDANPRWTAVDEYITETLVQPDAALQHALDASVAAGMPAIAVAPNQGKLLFMLARMQRARAILEIGTLGGYSTIWLARGLEKGGRVESLEVDPKHALVATENIARARLTHLVDVHVGPALELLPQVKGPFDMVFIDADKPNIPAYFEWAVKLSRPGALIVVDNVIREGAVADGSSTDASVLGVRRLNEMIAADSRIEATTIQTVGSKGWDGLTFALVVG